MTNKVKIGGTWRDVTDGYVKINGVWRKIVSTYSKINESWDRTYNNIPIPSTGFVFGVKIDTTNSDSKTAVTYTDNAVGFTPASGNDGNFNYGSWQDKYPFNQIKPCLLKNGVVQYYLNPNDYSKKVNGTSADITSGNDGDVMIEFPKIYWKFETIGTDLYIRYSDVQIDSGYKCLAHTRGTTEKNKVYLSAYLGFESDGKLRSLSGKLPTYSKRIGDFRTLAQANGSGYEQIAYFQLLMLQVLYIIMFKNRDSQTALGRGYVDGNTSVTVTGGSDAKGIFYGETSGKQQLKLCGIEDFYGNLHYMIDGLFSGSNKQILINTQDFNDKGTGYTSYYAGDYSTSISGYVKQVKGTTESGFIIKEAYGTIVTYYPDKGSLSASKIPYFGGNFKNSSDAGAFALSIDSGSSESSSTRGSRLMYL